MNKYGSGFKGSEVQGSNSKEIAVGWRSEV
jgi:hypothetical protein